MFGELLLGLFVLAYVVLTALGVLIDKRVRSVKDQQEESGRKFHKKVVEIFEQQKLDRETANE